MNSSRAPAAGSRLKINLLANVAGTGGASLMQIAFVPLYIRYMGVEAYGLVGFFVALTGVLQVFDLGFSPTMNREMARSSVQPERAAEARDLARTLEAAYWAIGLAIGAGILLLAPWIATHWVHPATLSVAVVRQAILLMGLLALVQWPLTLYVGGLIGLQRQPLLNALQVGLSALGHCGAVLVLWRLSPTITAFLTWQIVVGTLRLALIALAFWRSVPHAERAAHFNLGRLREIWRFSAGMGGITVTTLILTQADKVILSKLISLQMFGYYTLAGTVGGGVAVIAGPVYNLVFPQLSALVASGNLNAIKRFYHQSAQLMSVIILPVATLLGFFASDILLAWTGTPDVAQNAAPIVSLLALGSALNSVMVLPYSLQLAYGWTGLGVRLNTLFIILLVPLIIVLATRYGPAGAAAVWALLNGLYLVLGAPLTYRRLLTGEGRRWFLEDVLLPALGVVAVLGVARALLPHPMPRLITAGLMPVLLAASMATAALLAGRIRAWAFEWARSWLPGGGTAS